MTITTEQLIERLDTNHQQIMAAAKKTDGAMGDITARLEDLEQKGNRRGGGPDIPTTWGSSVAASAEYKQFIGAMGMKGRVAIPVKAQVTTAANSAGALIAPDRQAEIVALPRQRLTVRNLLAPGRTTSNLVEYPKQVSFTNNASSVAEGAAKPQSDIEFKLEQTPVRTIAHWIPVSRQAMQDAVQLQSLIDSEMRYGLALEEERQMLFGTGADEDLLGLIPQATLFERPFEIENETMLDILLLGIAQAQQTMLPATGIVVNDLDWAKMQALKDGQGRYIGAGPFGLQPAVAWTLPVVPTPAMPAGEFLVGSFGLAAQIFDHLDPTIFVSDSHADFFIRNMLAVLCEERLALAVKRPQALIYGSFDAETP